MFKKVSIFVLCLSLVGLDSTVAFSARKKNSKKRAAARRVIMKKNTVAQQTTTTATTENTQTTTTAEPAPAPAPAMATPPSVTVNAPAPTNDLNARSAALMKAMANARQAQEEREKKEKAEQKAEINKVANELQQKIDSASSACSGIKSNIDRIFGLTTATTVASGLGTVAAGVALTTGIMKSNLDKKIDRANAGDLTDEKNFQAYLDRLQRVTLEGGTASDIDNADAKKSKTLGNIRSIGMATATVTSGVSLGTSIASTLSAGKLADKMEDCDRKVADVRYAKANAEALLESSSDSNLENLVNKAQNISSKCSGFDKQNINTLKNMMTASAVVSGIGTATGAAGTVTSIMANKDSVRNDDSEAGKRKEKKLNLASNILAGVTAGASASTTVISGIALTKAKKDSGVAGDCEGAF